MKLRNPHETWMSELNKKRLPFGLSVPQLFEWGWRAIVGLLIVASLYLNTVYATKAEIVQTVDKIEAVEKKYAALPDRVDAVTQNFQSHIVSDGETIKTLTMIRSEMASVRATQAQAMKNSDQNFDRIFRKLDSTSR